jgi:hypothetical protein
MWAPASAGMCGLKPNAVQISWQTKNIVLISLNLSMATGLIRNQVAFRRLQIQN